MSSARPWWASPGPVAGGVDPDQDPVEVHRAARRGRDPDDAGGADAGRDVPPGEAPDPDVPSVGASGHDPPYPGSEVCSVCPVCITARMLGESRPELLSHLIEVGRHLSAVLRTLVETPPEPGSHHHDTDAPGMGRIDLD